MSIFSLRVWGVALTACALAGCANYTWTSSVPAGLRTVAVPTFRNESDVTELGSVMTRQVLREIQREGTLKVRATGDAALEVQGVVKKAATPIYARDRRTNKRLTDYGFTAEVEISVVDKKAGAVLIDGRIYKPSVSFVAREDLVTAERDASGRLAEELARQVVDDILNLKWDAARKETEK